ncbi:hypothetical protein [Streptomyces sp. TR06-5]|uniref:hypothetical protein n=1 Tax=unclassified Streptomyces TaxID=2593676 RepID=UPI0039A0B84B
MKSPSIDKQGSRRLARVSGRVATAVASYLSQDVMHCKNEPEIPASPHLGELVR